MTLEAFKLERTIRFTSGKDERAHQSNSVNLLWFILE